VTTMALSITVNGARRTCEVASNAVLADVLRDTLGLRGCKVACDQGVCGACTVLMDGRPIAACATFAFAADGRSVVTVEGLAQDGVLHAVQTSFLENSAFQCGFCTAGMMLSIVALLRTHPAPDDDTIRDWLAGNLCRCTGYAQIVEAIRQAANAVVLERA
jgi:aerobic carbon-monoxide dehydrogenase small subunit